MCRVHMHALYRYICIYIYIYIYIYICVCVYVCIRIYTETDAGIRHFCHGSIDAEEEIRSIHLRNLRRVDTDGTLECIHLGYWT